MAENETIQSQGEEVAVLSHVDDYLKIGQDYDCSDIHIATNAQPTWRRYGTLQPIWENGAVLTALRTPKNWPWVSLTEKEKARLKKTGDVDFAYQNSFGRFRASVVVQRLGYDICFRIINTKSEQWKNWDFLILLNR